MNLIEQLGGYAAAKAKCDRANKEGYLLLSVPVQNGFGDIYVYKVEAALLEYRRANNIFEVGDFIVSTLEPDTWWKSEVMRIMHIHKNMLICESKHGDVHQYNVRHASDAEIEAGKRLELTNGKI